MNRLNTTRKMIEQAFEKETIYSGFQPLFTGKSHVNECPIPVASNRYAPCLPTAYEAAGEAIWILVLGSAKT